MEHRVPKFVAGADDEVICELDPEPSGSFAESFHNAVVVLGHRHVLARFTAGNDGCLVVDVLVKRSAYPTPF